MPYSSYEDRVLPYHLDGTIIKHFGADGTLLKTFTPEEMRELNDEDYTRIDMPGSSDGERIIVFFPEEVVITGIFCIVFCYAWDRGITNLQVSSDSTNGFDGTWTDVTMPSGYNPIVKDLDAWRRNWKPVENANNVRVLRFQATGPSPTRLSGIYILHLYGHKADGQTPDDILFVDPGNSYAEFSAPLDFGDVASGSSSIKMIAVKNASPTKTASNVVLQVEDPDDIIRIGESANGPWLTSQTITSLAPGATSSDYYIKCETPAPPTPLGPNRAPIKVSVGSWS